jgi:hypothetical protein
MKKVVSKVSNWLTPYKNLIKWISWGVNLLATIVLVYWIFEIPIKFGETSFEQEPLLVGLTLLFATLNQIHRWLLSESEYSPAYALASGYVTNFLSPVITQLLENGEKNPVIYVYKPKNLSELFKNNIDRVKAEIQNNDFILNEVNLTLKHARARDILLVQKSKTKKIYFDFPNTLTSFISYVDYKINSKEDNSSEKAKEKLTNDLIEMFYQKVDELLKKENIQANVKYCDREMNLQF